jgi:hypothetical protein
VSDPGGWQPTCSAGPNQAVDRQLRPRQRVVSADLVVLVVVAVAHRRLGPSSLATTSTTCRALPSSAVHAHCWSRPRTTTRLPLHRDSAACSAWSRQTITVKNDGSCSRRPDTATRNLVRAIPPSVERTSGSSVRLPAKLTLASVMVLPPVAWPGGLPCPWNRGTVDTVACRESTRGKRRSQRSRPCDQVAGHGRLGCRVGWWGACGWGSGMPAPSGQIPPPWAWWENEAPAARAARSSSQAQPVRLSTSCRCGVGMRSAGRWNSAPEGLCGRTTVRT